VYGFIDTLTEAVVYSDLRASLRHNVLTQTGATQSGATRTVACTGTTSNCAVTQGWYVDLPESKERVTVDPLIAFGTVAFASNVPTNSACDSGGHSWINFLSLLNGDTVASSETGTASQYLSSSLSVGLSFVTLDDGRVIGTSVGSDTTATSVTIPVEPPSPIGRRVSWREIKRQ
jgi:type IV pilus assembly protein PilY1